MHLTREEEQPRVITRLRWWKTPQGADPLPPAALSCVALRGAASRTAAWDAGYLGKLTCLLWQPHYRLQFGD